jgi:release factor glutamine methyltransferase
LTRIVADENHVTLHTALMQGAKLLEEAGVDAPRLTAEVLLGYATHVDRTYFYAHPEQELREVEWIHFGRYLHERMRGKPTQYITHRQEFYGREFAVSPAVLIPRPETEHLVEAALPLVRGVVVDVGSGSGAIGITLALECKSLVIAADISSEALAVTVENARALGAAIAPLRSDLLTAFADDSVDLVVSNPPYVAESVRESIQKEVRDWEPGLALFGGADGLEVYRRLIPEAWRVLRTGGHLVLELGFDSLPEVEKLLGVPVTVHKDLAGIARVLVCQKA